MSIRVLLRRIVRVVAGDEAYAAHVRRQRVDLVHTPCRLDALVEGPQVAHLELVSFDRAVLGLLQVDPTHEVALRPQEGHEVMADEAACASHQNPRPLAVHLDLPRHHFGCRRLVPISGCAAPGRSARNRARLYPAASLASPPPAQFTPRGDTEPGHTAARPRNMKPPWVDPETWNHPEARSRPCPQRDSPARPAVSGDPPTSGRRHQA